MKVKQKLFGFKGLISPSSAINDLNEEWELEEISFSIKNGSFEIKYFNENDQEKALLIANTFITVWSFKHNTKLNVNFNHFWEPKKEVAVSHSLNPNDSVRIADTMKHAITHRLSFEIKARIVGKSSSTSFLTNQSLVQKSLEDKSLKQALEFYSEEVIDEKRPLIGIYKALEVLIAKLSPSGNKTKGMKVLGKLASKDFKYADEVKESAQSERHAITAARNTLSKQECKDRMKLLIESYANSI